MLQATKLTVFDWFTDEENLFPKTLLLSSEATKGKLRLFYLGYCSLARKERLQEGFLWWNVAEILEFGHHCHARWMRRDLLIFCQRWLILKQCLCFLRMTRMLLLNGRGYGEGWTCQLLKWVSLNSRAVSVLSPSRFVPAESMNGARYQMQTGA
jgi:hypothetical protein